MFPSTAAVSFFPAATILWILSSCVTYASHYAPDYAQDAKHRTILQSCVNELIIATTEPPSCGYYDVTLMTSMQTCQLWKTNIHILTSKNSYFAPKKIIFFRTKILKLNFYQNIHKTSWQQQLFFTLTLVFEWCQFTWSSLRTLH